MGRLQHSPLIVGAEGGGLNMHEGMLWFDNSDQRTLSDKIARAAKFYEFRYGHAPTLCFVNPLWGDVATLKLDNIEVHVTNSVLPNYFWLGVKD